MVAHLTVLLVLLQFYLINGLIQSSAGSGGGLVVTLGVFSGRRDPTWSVAAKDPSYKTIVDRLAKARKAGVVYNLEAAPARLGYKGFAVQEGKTRPQLIVGANTIQLQQLLLKTIPKNLISLGVLKYIQKEISTGAVKANPLKKYKRYAPPYNPDAWNTPNHAARWCNNCYNYALDRQEDNAAQPGGQAIDFALTTGPHIQSLAEHDGLIAIPAGPQVPDAPPGNRHLVALFAWEGEDFHWYRLDHRNDNTKRWSHKMSTWLPPTDKDSSNNIITDPRQAQNPPDKNYQFVSFMTVDRNTVQVVGSLDCQRVLQGMAMMNLLDQ